MAEFEAKVYKLIIEDHPNADALEIAVVGDYRSVVRKNTFNTGDLGVYIPCQAVLPEWLIEDLGLVGKLAGKNKNRVKEIKLRKVLSEGIILPTYQHGLSRDLVVYGEDECDREFIREGDVVTEFLGITKYEPEIPSSMNGEVRSFVGHTIKYDIENIKKYPDVLVTDEEVVITEKIHGTWACFGYHPDCSLGLVTSKGLSGRGLIFKMNSANENNLYVKTYQEFDMYAARKYVNEYFAFRNDSLPFYVLGEIFGRGVQDLHYGQDKPAIRIFDVYVGEPGVGRYLNFYEKRDFAESVGVPLVPVLYVGKYTKDVVDNITDGGEFASNKSNPEHMREGIVITPTFERTDDEIGRVILKSVSEDYLLRKGGTEYN